MKVKELIEKLKEYDSDSNVSFKCFDGSDYSDNIAHTERATLIYYKDIKRIGNRSY